MYMYANSVLEQCVWLPPPVTGIDVSPIKQRKPSFMTDGISDNAMPPNPGNAKMGTNIQLTTNCSHDTHVVKKKISSFCLFENFNIK